MPDPRSPAGPQAPPDMETKNLPPRGGVGSGGGGGGWSGTGPGVGGAASPSEPIQRIHTVPPWFDVRPPSAREIGPLRALQAGFTAANTPAVLPFAFTLPSARTGAIKSFGIQASNLLLTSQIFWTIFFNEIPVQGFTDVSLYPAAAVVSGLNWEPSEVNLIVPEASVITVGVNVLDGGTYQLGAELHGWHVASKLHALTESLYRV